MFGIPMRCCLYSTDMGQLREVSAQTCFDKGIHYQPRAIMPEFLDEPGRRAPILSYFYVGNTQEIQARNDALLSLDKEQIIKYCNDYWVVYPQNENQFWIDVHLARVFMSKRKISLRQKSYSRAWLAARGIWIGKMRKWRPDDAWEETESFE